jgi:hypothetical protein
VDFATVSLISEIHKYGDGDGDDDDDGDGDGDGVNSEDSSLTSA